MWSVLGQTKHGTATAAAAASSEGEVLFDWCGSLGHQREVIVTLGRSSGCWLSQRGGWEVNGEASEVLL